MKIDDKNMEILILEAATKLFLEQGFAKTTMGQIAKEAGCNQALVHYYYRTKDNLFDKIFEDKIQFMLTNILSIDSGGESLEDKIAKMIEFHFDFLEQNPKLVPFIFHEISTNTDHFASLVDKLHQYPKSVFALLDASLKKEIEKGNFQPIETIDLILTIVSLNIVPFLMKPMFQHVMSISDDEYFERLELRKKENIQTVLSRLRR